MINPMIILVVETFFSQSQVSTNTLIDDMCQVEKNIVLMDRDYGDAIVVLADSMVLSDDFVYSIQNELCSYKQDLNQIMFTDKERFPP